MPSESDALRAERDELLEALKELWSVVALAWPGLERSGPMVRARQAIARSEAFPLEVSGKDPPSVGE